MYGGCEMSSSGTSQVVGVTRHGETLVVAQGAILPDRCFKCGQPATGKLLKKKFRWHPSWFYLLIFLGMIFYLVAVAVASRRMELLLPLCEAHRKQRRASLIIGIVLLLICIPAGSLLAQVVSVGWAFLVWLMLFIASLVFLVVGERTLTPTYIGESQAVFKGADSNFLLHLAEGPLPEKTTSTAKIGVAFGVVLILLLALGAYLEWEDTRWERLFDAGQEALAQGRYAEAEKKFLAAVEAAEAFGGDDSRLGVTLNNLAVAYHDQGKLDEAEPLYKQAIKVYERTLGLGHPEVATTLENYAGLLRDTGREDEAEKAASRAAAIRAKQGQENPQG